MSHFWRSARIFQFVELAHRNLFAFLLICNVRLVDLESLLVQNEQVSPILLRCGLCVCLLNANQEAALKVEQGIQIQENVVHLVAADDALLLYQLLELLQQLQMLDVGALRLDQFIDDMLSLCSLGRANGGVYGLGGLGNLAQRNERVQHTVYYVDDLQKLGWARERYAKCLP